MTGEAVETTQAPAAIGPYSQAIRCGSTVYLSGQIPLVAGTTALANATIEDEIHQVFKNLAAVATASGGDLRHAVELNIFLTDLVHFPRVNELMSQYFEKPYPARATIGVASLPRGARIEADAVLMLS